MAASTRSPIAIQGYPLGEPRPTRASPAGSRYSDGLTCLTHWDCWDLWEGVVPQQPMYQQIADDLRRQIESGVLSPGQQLPTELDLREKYDASRNTVRDAIKRLTSLGLVETRP